MTTRRDLHLHNEANGWVLTSGTRNGRPEKDFTKPGSATWAAAIDDASIVPMALFQDDSFDVRVVVGGELSAQETEEWVDRLTWKLAIPDGRLVITAGTEWLEGDDPDGEYSREMEVPAGTYQVDVYTYLPGVNGAPCLAKAGVKEAGLRKWLKATRPGVTPPAWLAERMGEEKPSAEEQARRDAFRKLEEENHEAQRRSWRAWPLDPLPTEDATSKDERVPIDFVVHLTSLREEIPMSSPKKGWFAHVQAPRKPDRCPLGIYSEHVPMRVDTAVSPAPPSVGSRVKDRALRALPGGPITVDVATELPLPFWVALLCKADLVTELEVDLRGAEFPVSWPSAASGINASRRSNGWTIGVDGWGHHAVRRLHRLAGLLAALPDGATLEMNVAPDPQESVREQPAEETTRLDAGSHRYRGQVRGGMWHIAEISQPVDATALRDALAIAREVDGGGPVTARSESEANAMWTDLEANGTNYKMGKLFGGAPVKRAGNALHPASLQDVIEPGVVAFRARFRGVWPLHRSW